MTVLDRVMVAVALATALWWALSRRGRPAALEALSTAAEGIGNAFGVAAIVAVGAGLVAVAALPRASRFLPKLRLSPQAMPMH